MTFNIAFRLEQQQREQQHLEVCESEINKETDLYASGDFDGGIGIEPDREKWDKYAYRSGLLVGITRHYDNKYKMSLANEPF